MLGAHLLIRRLYRPAALCLALASCAAPPPPPPQPTPLVGRVTQGTVLAVRGISGADTGARLVQSALGLNPLEPQTGAHEILVGHDTGAVAVLLTQPGAAPLQPGQSVEIIEAADTALKPN